MADPHNRPNASVRETREPAPEATAGEQELENLLQDPAAVEDIMALYGIDRKTAQTVWAKFSDTVHRLKAETQ